MGEVSPQFAAVGLLRALLRRLELAYRHAQEEQEQKLSMAEDLKEALLDPANQPLESKAGKYVAIPWSLKGSNAS